MRLGRERPPKIRPRTVIGGWQRGSLTPQMPPTLLLTAAPTATRAAKSAALSTRAKLLIVRNIAKCEMPTRSGQSASWTDEVRAGRRGTTPPESVVPPIFLRFRDPLHRQEARSHGI
jgi:hypothetical protein